MLLCWLSGHGESFSGRFSWVMAMYLALALAAEAFIVFEIPTGGLGMAGLIVLLVALDLAQ